MRSRPDIQRLALSVTRWVGSPVSLIVHTILFLGSFIIAWLGYVDFDEMQLVLLSLVSLEAIYLAIFIQMTINYTTQELAEVGEDIEEMQEDIGEIQEDVGELQEDIEDIGEDVEEMTEEEEADEHRKQQQKKTLEDIQTDLRKLMTDIDKLRASLSLRDNGPDTRTRVDGMNLLN
jgi:methyl-accepting chemotaxis protein